jgi:hypothetical protein
MNTYDSIEYYDDETINRWLEMYDKQPDKLYLEAVGFSLFDVQVEYLRRCQINDEMDEWRGK